MSFPKEEDSLGADFEAPKGERIATVFVYLGIVAAVFLTGLNPGLVGMVVAAIAVSVSRSYSDFSTEHYRKLFHVGWLTFALLFVNNVLLGIPWAHLVILLAWLGYSLIGAWRAWKGQDPIW